jgi:hypothetical protein
VKISKLHKNNIVVKKVILISLVLTILALFVGCEKPEPPVPPVTYTVSIVKVGSGSVETDKMQGITSGATVNFKFTPASGYSLYSIKVNGTSINAIIPFDSEYEYSYFGINGNLQIEVTFVKTSLLMLSVQEPAWKWTKMEKYRAKDDSYSHPVTLTFEQTARRFYYLYPSMDLKVLNPDSSVYGQNKWDLKNDVYIQWGDTLTFISLTPNKFMFKAKPVWSDFDKEYLYAVYTYERIPY